MQMTSHRVGSGATIGMLLAACGIDARNPSVADMVEEGAMTRGGQAAVAPPRELGNGGAAAGILAPGASEAGGAGASAPNGAPAGLGPGGGRGGGGNPLQPPGSAAPNPLDFASIVDPTSTGLFVGGNPQGFLSMGIAVAGGADVNGDALEDFAVGANSYFGSEGMVFVVFGDVRREHLSVDDVPSAVAGLRLDGQGPDGYGLIGAYLAMLGDVNGDGFADFMTSTAFQTAGSWGPGSYLVIFGGPSGGTVDIGRITRGEGGGFMITGEGLDVGQSGRDVSESPTPFAPAGDVNGDSAADILITSTSSGVGYVVFGKGSSSPVQLSDIEANVAGLTYRAPGILQAPFIAVGDVNGDGATDMAALYRSAEYEYRVRVFFGQFGASGSVVAGDTNGFDVIPERSWSSFELAPAGDVNGDGLSDMLIGMTGAGVDGNGVAYVVFGTSDTSTIDLASQAGAFAIHRGPRAPDNSRLRNGFATALTSAGDVNGDGLADILVTDPDEDSVYLIFGKSDEQPVLVPTLESAGRGRRVLHFDRPERDPQGFRYTPAFLGAAINPAGDLDGDGRRDFVIGAPQAPQGADASGAAIVLFGAALLAPPPPL